MVSSAVEIAIIALAAYRVAWLITAERGPFDLAEKWRGFIMEKYPITREKPQHWISVGWNCPLCAGFWVSAVLYGLWQWEISRFLIIFLAIAGLQAFLERRK
jgi:hypothetical protein